MNIEEEIEEARQCCKCASKHGDEFDSGYFQGVIETLERLQKNIIGGPEMEPTAEYPQATEDNEYRYIDAGWLDDIAAGLTAGAGKYPGETWRSTPAKEHASRAFRHLNLYRKGDQQEPHLLNASMRCMMAYVMDREGEKMK